MTPSPTTEAPPDFEQPEWPETPAPTVTPTAAPKYALSLKCANAPAGENASINAFLTLDGTPACDPSMQASVVMPGGEKRVLTLADSSNCVSNGAHVFVASGLKPGNYQATVSSLGGSSAKCVFRVLEPTAAQVPWELAGLIVIIVAAIAGGYYYYKKKKGGARKPALQEEQESQEE